MRRFSKENDRSEIVAIADLVIGDSEATLSFSGDWIYRNKRTPFTNIERALLDSSVKEIKIEAKSLGAFDTALIAFLINCHDFCGTKDIVLNYGNLPEGPRSMLSLACSVPSKKEADKERESSGLIMHMGMRALDTIENATAQVSFIGEVTISIAKFFAGKSSMRFQDLMLVVQRAGAEALPIVALISFLVGLILAFVGGVQLAQYGSEIYIADLVGLAMVREMGVIMVGIVMAGRTGAAFSAELGTMKVNEEISAFQTFGISPMEFLVLPRMIALVAMFPLLTIFADFIGILGGLVIGVGLFDLNVQQYMNRTLEALTMTQLLTGFGKSFVFGIIVALIGCMKGLNCGNSSAAVGLCTTSSVVTSIKVIIIADAIFAVIFNIFNI